MFLPYFHTIYKFPSCFRKIYQFPPIFSKFTSLGLGPCSMLYTYWSPWWLPSDSLAIKHRRRRRPGIGGGSAAHIFCYKGLLLFLFVLGSCHPHSEDPVLVVDSDRAGASPYSDGIVGWIQTRIGVREEEPPQSLRPSFERSPSADEELKVLFTSHFPA